MKKKLGFFFTYDALIALTLLGFGILLVTSVSFQKVAPTVNYEEMHYLAEDAMTLFSITPLKDLNASYVSYLVNKTNITVSDESKDLDEIIALLWAYNQTNYAANLTKTFLRQFFGKKYNYSLILIDNTGGRHLIYSSTGKFPEDSGNIKALTSASRLISGYEKNALPRGYVARAQVSTTQNVMVIPIEPAGSGDVDGEYFILNKSFKFLPTDRPQDLKYVKINSAILYVSAHTDVPPNMITTGNKLSLTNNPAFQIYFDGKKINKEFTVVNNISSIFPGLTLTPWGYTIIDFYALAIFGYVNLTQEFQNSISSGEVWHTIKIMLENRNFKRYTGYNVHMHPGTFLIINYSLPMNVTAYVKPKKYVAKRIYLDDLISQDYYFFGSGLWFVLPIEIPKGSIIHNIYLRLNISGLIQTTVYSYPTFPTYIIYFNNKSIITSYTSETNKIIYVNLTNLIKDSKKQQNIILAEFDCYETNDTFYGGFTLHLFSDPIHDPNDSSYLFINYTPPKTNIYKYGKAPLYITQFFGGNDLENPKYTLVYFNGSPILTSHVRAVSLGNNNLTLKIINSETNSYVFVSPKPRDVPTSIYVNPTYYQNPGNNTLELRDNNCQDCDFSNYSILDYVVLINSSVGYGNVFNTLKAAEEDAINRLKRELGIYAKYVNINANSLNITISNVPSMYGPVILKLEVWKS